MEYYTQRHNIRKPIEKTEEMSVEMYALLFDCCSKYFENIAWKYPKPCPDNNLCSGVDYQQFYTSLKFDIPSLFRDEYNSPAKPDHILWGNKNDEFDQYALLDLIELVYENIKDINRREWHSFFRHEHIMFSSSGKESKKGFKEEINGIFAKTGLQYHLNADGMVERSLEESFITNVTESEIDDVTEKGLKQLLQDALILYKTPNPASREDATEKMWDALERLKTYYTDRDKKKSVEKIIKDMSKGEEPFRVLFDEEFQKLTMIDNTFRIRHHEREAPRKHYVFLRVAANSPTYGGSPSTTTDDRT